MENLDNDTFDLNLKKEEPTQVSSSEQSVNNPSQPNPITVESGAGANMAEPVEKISLYNPSQYGFLGFIFSLLPVFFMSFSNAKFLPNGEAISGTMKKFLAVFVLLFFLNIVVLMFSSVSLVKAINQATEENPTAAMNLYYSNEGGFSDSGDVVEALAPKEFLFYGTVLNYSGEIFMGLNLILLIFVVRFTSKNELPVYRKLNDDGKVETKKFLVPVLIGIGFICALYLGTIPLLEFFTKLAV